MSAPVPDPPGSAPPGSGPLGSGSPLPARPVSNQMRAADPARLVAVSANAGSGKTSTLVDRVARLLLRGARPEAVLCVTYTKAAAAEMQRRLFERLGGWSVLDDERLREELHAIGEDPRDLPKARTLFARALETPGGLRIQTLHAFCEQLLRRFPLEAGVSPGFQVLEDAAQRETSAGARERLAEAALADPGGRIGAAYAHLAVELDGRAFEGLLAGFESGRGAVAAYSRQCAELGVALEDDVWRRAGFPDAPADPDALEHAAAGACDWAQWRSASAALALTGAKTDLDLSGKLKRLAECAATSPGGFSDCWVAFSTKEGEPSKRLGTKGVDADTLAWLQREQARLHSTCRLAAGARQARDTVHALTLAVAYVELYEGAKAAQGALDFSDLISRAGALLTVQADAAWVLYKLDGGMEHVLLDEAQDTSPGQWEILRALTDEFFAGEGARSPARLDRSVFVVGDQKQSIYGFQGAAPERLREETLRLEAAAHRVGRDFDQVPLIESWRSTPQVLGFVDALFADPATRTAVAPPEGEEVVRHTVGHVRAAHAGGVDLWALFRDEKREAPSAWDAPLDTPPVDGARKRLARRIAAAVVEAIARGDGVYDKDLKAHRPLHAGDVLVLVRRRDALFEEILRALKAAGLPVAGADRLKLSEHALFADLRALLRFVLYPWDDLTVAELLRSPLCEVDEQGLYDLAHPRPPGRNLWAELNQQADHRPDWAAAKAVLTWARSQAHTARGPFEWLGRVLSHIDPRGLTLRQRLVTRLGAETEDACEALLAEALAAEGRGVRDLERFCAELERAQVEVKREMEAAGAQVRVMTVHGAKGLEAPVVILPDTTGRPPAPAPALMPTEDGGLVFASRGSADTPVSAAAREALKARQGEEGLRLLYVALTRARDRLIVCGRLPSNQNAPAEDSWYARIAAAFGRPEVEAQTRALVEPDGLALRRFGPDPAPALELAALEPATPSDPAWLTAPAPAESAAAALASPGRAAERMRGSAPSPLAAAGGLGRFRRGELIHRLLQLLPDLPAGARAQAAADILARERDLSPEHRREMADSAMGVLSDPRFAPVWGEGGRAEMAVAGGSPELPEGLHVSGRVDRLVVTPERVLVVDFKTNRPSPDRIEGADPAYLMQMALYVAVLRQVFPGRRVEAALVWTDGPKLMAVPDNVIDGELARARRAG